MSNKTFTPAQSINSANNTLFVRDANHSQIIGATFGLLEIIEQGLGNEEERRVARMLLTRLDWEGRLLSRKVRDKFRAVLGDTRPSHIRAEQILLGSVRMDNPKRRDAILHSVLDDIESRVLNFKDACAFMMRADAAGLIQGHRVNERFQTLCAQQIAKRAADARKNPGLSEHEIARRARKAAREQRLAERAQANRDLTDSRTTKSKKAA